MTDVSRLRELWERGTTGPWRHAKRDGSHRIDTDGWPVADCGFGNNDAALIAAMHTALPALLDEVERLRKVEAEQRGEERAREAAETKHAAWCDEIHEIVWTAERRSTFRGGLPDAVRALVADLRRDAADARLALRLALTAAREERDAARTKTAEAGAWAMKVAAREVVERRQKGESKSGNDRGVETCRLVLIFLDELSPEDIAAEALRGLLAEPSPPTGGPSKNPGELPAKPGVYTLAPRPPPDAIEQAMEATRAKCLGLVRWHEEDLSALADAMASMPLPAISSPRPPKGEP